VVVQIKEDIIKLAGLGRVLDFGGHKVYWTHIVRVMTGICHIQFAVYL
jgi:hypothetical protein